MTDKLSRVAPDMAGEHPLTPHMFESVLGKIELLTESSFALPLTLEDPAASLPFLDDIPEDVPDSTQVGRVFAWDDGKTVPGRIELALYTPESKKLFTEFTDHSRIPSPPIGHIRFYKDGPMGTVNGFFLFLNSQEILLDVECNEDPAISSEFKQELHDFARQAGVIDVLAEYEETGERDYKEYGSDVRGLMVRHALDDILGKS